MSLASRMRRWIWLPAFACALANLHAGLIFQPEFSPGSGIEAQVINFYDRVPPNGFLPVRVKIRNGSEASHTWRLDASDRKHRGGRENSSVSSVFTLTVDAQSEKTFDLLVPLSPSADLTSRYTTIFFSLSGHAITNGGQNLSVGTSGRTITPFLGMGDSLAVKNWEPLKDMLEKQGYATPAEPDTAVQISATTAKLARATPTPPRIDPVTLDGTSLDVSMLPQDWRGLAGFSAIIFTDDEWRKIPAAERTALQDWIAQGGKLILCHGGSTADLPAEGAYGTGSIEYWPMGEDFLNRASDVLKNLPRLSFRGTTDNYASQWLPAREVGAPDAPTPLILTFVVVFAGIVGPLNFLVLAPAGRRHRLFWTTPLISVSASVLLGLFIALSEGFGGRGQRFEVLLNLPDQHKNVSWQEQVARTGVLGGTSFVLNSATLILPIEMGQPDVHFSRGDSTSYQLDGSTWSGDWFRSRSTQAQLLTTVSPTRSRLEISSQTDGKPVATSSFESDLEELWYLDENGKSWKTGKMKPGEKRTLEAAGEERDFTRWLETNLAKAGTVARDRATAFKNNGGLKGKFFASTKNPHFFPSLTSIRWEKGDGLILGYPAR